MLEKLKQYQEIITIIIFFLGGFFWVEDRFPQKTDLDSFEKRLQDKNEKLECLLKKNMSLVQDQVRVITLKQEIEEKRKFLSDAGENIAPLFKSKTEKALHDDEQELGGVTKDMQTMTKELLQIDVCNK